MVLQFLINKYERLLECAKEDHNHRLILAYEVMLKDLKTLKTGL